MALPVVLAIGGIAGLLGGCWSLVEHGWCGLPASLTTHERTAGRSALVPQVWRRVRSKGGSGAALLHTSVTSCCLCCQGTLLRVGHAAAGERAALCECSRILVHLPAQGKCTFGARLADEDIRALAAFVLASAEQGWPQQ